MKRAGWILAALLLATPAAAAPAPNAEAKKYFDTGVQFYKDGRFTEALSAFMEANRLSPRESAERNIAQTYRDLHDFASAYQAYDELLAKYGNTMKASDRLAAETARTELAAMTGVIAITFTDPDATIAIDGKDAGHPPATVRLKAGTHTIAITRPGYETLESTIELVGRDTPTIAGPLVAVKAAEPTPVEPPPPPPVEPPPPPPPVEPPPPPPPPSQTRGLYTRFAIGPMFPTGHHDTVEDHSVYGTTIPTDGGGLYGAALDVRIGYALGELGIEGTLTGAYDHSSTTVHAVGHTDDWSFHRGGGTLGVGARWLPNWSALGPVRPTAGLALGLSGRAIGASRVVEDTSTHDRARFDFYLTPTFLFDAGVTIGKVPGGRLFVGLLALLDLPSAQTLPSAKIKDGSFPIPQNAQLKVATGPEFAIGPTFGLVLGH